MERTSQIGKRIKLRDLQILQAAAQSQSMIKAARQLGITQPAVSYAISSIEQVLGVPLLDRTVHGVSPTIYGMALLERSSIIFNELRQGISEIATLSDPSAGEMRIGATAPMAAIVSIVFNRLHAQFPKLRFELLTGETSNLLRALRRREIEVVVSRTSDSAASQDDLTVETLFREELAVICGQSNKWGRRGNISLSKLISEPWIFPPPQSIITELIRREFEGCGLEMPRATITTSSTYALSVLLASGPFLAINPRSMLKTPFNRLKAVNLRLHQTVGPIMLSTLSNRSLTPAAKLFVNAARETATSMSPELMP